MESFEKKEILYTSSNFYECRIPGAYTDIFKYLQYCAFKQQDEVSKHISEVNLELGLYRDLPVGLKLNAKRTIRDLYQDVHKQVQCNKLLC